MNRKLCSLAFIAAAALAGCEPETITAQGPYDPNANLTNSSGPITLPPSIASSHSYRCKDNSLVHIDLLSDQKTAILRDPPTGTPTTLTAPDAGQPYVAEGHELTATIGNRTVTLARPGKGSQSCKA